VLDIEDFGQRNEGSTSERKPSLITGGAVVSTTNNTIVSVNVTLVDAIEVIIDENVTEIEIEYLTEAPQAFEENKSDVSKIITITGPDDLQYQNVIASTILPIEARLGSIGLYHLENESRTRTQFDGYDTNNNSLIDYIEWIVPHLSNQTYELVIEITKASHLDSNKVFISDIYDYVKAQDGNWSERINASEYVRVTFEVPLDNTRDITVYARGNASLEIYEENKTDLIATIPQITDEDTYKVLLTNLVDTQDTFDLKILGDYIEFDYIVDPEQTRSNISLNITDVFPLEAVNITLFNMTGTCFINVSTPGGKIHNITTPVADGRCQVDYIPSYLNGTYFVNGTDGTKVSDTITFNVSDLSRTYTIVGFTSNTTFYYPGKDINFSYTLNDSNDDLLNDVGFEEPQDITKVEVTSHILIERKLVSVNKSNWKKARINVKFDGGISFFDTHYAGTSVNISIYSANGAGKISDDIRISAFATDSTYIDVALTEEGSKHMFNTTIKADFVPSWNPHLGYVEFDIPPNRSLSDVVFSVDKIYWDFYGRSGSADADYVYISGQREGFDAASVQSQETLDTGFEFAKLGMFPIYLPLTPRNALTYLNTSGLNIMGDIDGTKSNNQSIVLTWRDYINDTFSTALCSDIWGYEEFCSAPIALTLEQNNYTFHNFGSNSTVYYPGEDINFTYILNDSEGSELNDIGFGEDFEEKTDKVHFMEIRRQLLSINKSNWKKAAVYVEFEGGCDTWDYTVAGTYINMSFYDGNGTGKISNDITLREYITDSSYVKNSLTSLSNKHEFNTETILDHYPCGVPLQSYVEFTIPPNRSLSDVVISVDNIRYNFYSRIESDEDYIVIGGDRKTIYGTNLEVLHLIGPGDEYGSLGKLPIHLPLTPRNTLVYLNISGVNTLGAIDGTISNNGSIIYPWRDYVKDNYTVTACADVWGFGETCSDFLNITLNTTKILNVTSLNINTTNYTTEVDIRLNYTVELDNTRQINFTSQDYNRQNVTKESSLEIRRELVAINQTGWKKVRLYVDFDAGSDTSWDVLYAGSYVNISLYDGNGTGKISSDIKINNYTTDPTNISTDLTELATKHVFNTQFLNQLAGMATTKSSYVEFDIPPDKSLGDVVFSVDKIYFGYYARIASTADYIHRRCK